jgi:hypothetical protein
MIEKYKVNELGKVSIIPREDGLSQILIIQGVINDKPASLVFNKANLNASIICKSEVNKITNVTLTINAEIFEDENETFFTMVQI